MHHAVAVVVLIRVILFCLVLVVLGWILGSLFWGVAVHMGILLMFPFVFAFIDVCWCCCYVMDCMVTLVL